jgi:hypothetical protein
MGILLFNCVGYRLLSNFMQDRACQRLESRLDRRQYDESQLISIKIPVKDLSYYNNSAVFERVDGQIDINGVPYQYVKRRLFNDSLELLCIPNVMSLKIRAGGNGYVKFVKEIERTDPYTVIDSFQIGEPSFTVNERGDYVLTDILSAILSTDERPPCRIS